MNIHRGEQFAVPFEIFIDEDSVTPENVDGLRVQLGDRLCEWPDGELEYDDDSGAWLYPLTEQQSLALCPGHRSAQVAVLIGDDIFESDVVGVRVSDSIIQRRWTTDE